MKKKVIGVIIIIIIVTLLVIGVLLLYTKDNTEIGRVPIKKQTQKEEIYLKLKEQLKVEGYSLEFIKHEGDIYYFNQVDQNSQIGFEVQYDEKTKTISTIDKNEISEGQVEEGHIDGTYE